MANFRAILHNLKLSKKKKVAYLLFFFDIKPRGQTIATATATGKTITRPAAITLTKLM